mmetsp:Transcript_34876/g.99233  ORF Transcript_34876/g.99233 Transcript_34876/m.99233 type:complete len:201 (-) Transcript_34876:267-869(-)
MRHSSSVRDLFSAAIEMHISSFPRFAAASSKVLWSASTSSSTALSVFCISANSARLALLLFASVKLPCTDSTSSFKESRVSSNSWRCALMSCSIVVECLSRCWLQSLICRSNLSESSCCALSVTSKRSANKWCCSCIASKSSRNFFTTLSLHASSCCFLVVLINSPSLIDTLDNSIFTSESSSACPASEVVKPDEDSFKE